ncbi:carcinoembryonic antigen-related cell adhesion molecule 5-like [Micropterus dolomieu]|uniref:carcinoembryonic antigen-related cell adhesion molecule 5-like n=1 Tax=Micropterus dolomieu TaxID=147949 RepID=UPI001E8E95CD|nr:carcinoembryonic antigen-related cell adhesion molecule 5-like [Micropterus dolomieu]
MEKKSEGTLAIVLLALIQGFLASSAVEVQPSINPAAVGDTVTLSLSPSITLKSGSWAVGESLILTWVGNQLAVFPSHSGRATANVLTGALTLSSVKVADSGVYAVQSSDPPFNANTSITVLEPISNVTLRANQTNRMEFNSSAVITCSVSSGSSLSFLWLNGSSEVTASNRVQLTDGNSTLTILSATRYDQGPFRCCVFNPVSNGTSDPVNFTIDYGPDNMAVTVNGQNKTSFSIGSNLAMLCSVQSNPPAQLQWAFRGGLVNTTGLLLKLFSVNEDQSGPYSCLAFNNLTNTNGNITIHIVIAVPISYVTVRANTTNLMELTDTAVLMCSVSNGSSPSYAWLNGSSVITAGGRVQLSNGGTTLTMVGVTRYDQGPFMCNVTNGISHAISLPVLLNISYGPMKPVITGVSVALAGTKEILNCSSASYPTSLISWYFNDSLLTTTSELAIGPLTLDMSGKYICIAFNNITKISSSAYTMLIFLAPVTTVSIKMVRAHPVLNHTFTLTCDSAGHVHSVIWMHNLSPLYPDNTRNFSIDNATLTFDPILHSDNGSYQCEASNTFSKSTSEIFKLDVVYGPDMPTITGPNVARTGDNVTLSCYAPSNPLSFYSWLFNGSLVANTSQYVTPLLTIATCGIYTCMAYNNITGKNSTAHRMLTVVDSIIDVQVQASMDYAIESNFYMLKCIVTGPAEHVNWMKNGEPLQEDNRTAINMANATVTFNPLETTDTGYYQCMAINAFDNKTSPPYKLLVNFGPRTPTIDGPAFAEKGNSAIFQCSAMSIPPSQFSWWFNGSIVANTSLFKTGPLSFNMSGEYTCMAYNYLTGKNSTTSKMLTVIGVIESVVIRNNTVPINFNIFTLTCQVTGPYDKIYWMKNNMPLNMNTPTAYHAKNNVLCFTPVTTNNDGIYQCVAVNQGFSHYSPQYILLVNYGPLSVNIYGPNSAEVGSSVSLNCSATCQPDCVLSWFFNKQSSKPLKTGSVFTFSVAKKNQGNYICMANNLVTNITKYQTKAVTVTGECAFALLIFDVVTALCP